jgi:hypothetical protein
VQGTKSIFTSRYILRLSPSCASCMHLPTFNPFEEDAEEEAAAALGFREFPASDLQAQGNRNSDFEE